jgi:hypothetical protein
MIIRLLLMLLFGSYAKAIPLKIKMSELTNISDQTCQTLIHKYASDKELDLRVEIQKSDLEKKAFRGRDLKLFLQKSILDAINVKLTLLDKNKHMESIVNSAFETCRNIKEMNLPNHIKNIDQYTFQFCYQLKKIDLPTSLELIKSYAFFYAKDLEEIHLPHGTKQIEYKAFARCESLKSFVLNPELRLINHFAFENCSSLINFDATQSRNLVLSNSAFGAEAMPKLVVSICLNNLTSEYKCFGYTQAEKQVLLGRIESGDAQKDLEVSNILIGTNSICKQILFDNGIFIKLNLPKNATLKIVPKNRYKKPFV